MATADSPAARGEALLLGCASMLTDADVRRLPGLEGFTLEELLQVPGLPRPIATTPKARYWSRRDLVAWWRRYAAAQ
jgi:hypothetical protein